MNYSRIALVFAIASSACSTRTVLPHHEIEPEKISTSAGYEDLLQSVDLRQKHETSGVPLSNFGQRSITKRKRTALSAVVKPTPPVGADRSENESVPPKELERQHAVEVTAGGERTFVVKPAGERPPPRWEVQTQTERCSRRPTQWARERCMEDGE